MIQLCRYQLMTAEHRQTEALIPNLFRALHGDFVDVPLLVLRRVVDRLVLDLSLLVLRRVVDRMVLDLSLLVLWCVVDRLVFAHVVRHVEFVSVERPWNKNHVALLVVERKMLHVQSAVRLDDGRKHPQDLSVRRDDRERVHKVLETVISAGTWHNIIISTKKIKYLPRFCWFFVFKCYLQKKTK